MSKRIRYKFAKIFSHKEKVTIIMKKTKVPII